MLRNLEYPGGNLTAKLTIKRKKVVSMLRNNEARPPTKIVIGNFYSS